MGKKKERRNARFASGGRRLQLADAVPRKKVFTNLACKTNSNSQDSQNIPANLLPPPGLRMPPGITKTNTENQQTNSNDTKPSFFFIILILNNFSIFNHYNIKFFSTIFVLLIDTQNKSVLKNLIGFDEYADDSNISQSDSEGLSDSSNDEGLKILENSGVIDGATIKIKGVDSHTENLNLQPPGINVESEKAKQSSSWEQVFDNSSGNFYQYNRETNESSQQKPIFESDELVQEEIPELVNKPSILVNDFEEMESVKEDKKVEDKIDEKSSPIKESTLESSSDDIKKIKKVKRSRSISSHDHDDHQISKRHSSKSSRKRRSSRSKSRSGDVRREKSRRKDRSRSSSYKRRKQSDRHISSENHHNRKSKSGSHSEHRRHSSSNKRKTSHSHRSSRKNEEKSHKRRNSIDSKTRSMSNELEKKRSHRGDSMSLVEDKEAKQSSINLKIEKLVDDLSKKILRLLSKPTETEPNLNTVNDIQNLSREKCVEYIEKYIKNEITDPKLLLAINFLSYANDWREKLHNSYSKKNNFDLFFFDKFNSFINLINEKEQSKIIEEANISVKSSEHNVSKQKTIKEDEDFLKSKQYCFRVQNEESRKYKFLDSETKDEVELDNLETSIKQIDRSSLLICLLGNKDYGGVDRLRSIFNELDDNGLQRCRIVEPGYAIANFTNENYSQKALQLLNASDNLGTQSKPIEENQSKLIDQISAEYNIYVRYLNNEDPESASYYVEHQVSNISALESGIEVDIEKESVNDSKHEESNLLEIEMEIDECLESNCNGNEIDKQVNEDKIESISSDNSNEDNDKIDQQPNLHSMSSTSVNVTKSSLNKKHMSSKKTKNILKDKKMSRLISQQNKVSQDLNPDFDTKAEENEYEIEQTRRREATERQRRTQETSHSADNPNLVPVSENWKSRFLK